MRFLTISCFSNQFNCSQQELSWFSVRMVVSWRSSDRLIGPKRLMEGHTRRIHLVVLQFYLICCNSLISFVLLIEKVLPPKNSNWRGVKQLPLLVQALCYKSQINILPATNKHVANDKNIFNRATRYAIAFIWKVKFVVQLPRLKCEAVHYLWEMEAAARSMVVEFEKFTMNIGEWGRCTVKNEEETNIWRVLQVHRHLHSEEFGSDRHLAIL